MNPCKKKSPAVVNPVVLSKHEQRKNISGEWMFALDADDTGIENRWYEDPDVYSGKITVPGCWQGQGYGDDSKEAPWDLGYRTRAYRASYTGTGWYARYFDIPKDWNGKDIWINFGGIHPSADIWINGIKAGENELPFASFSFNITGYVDCSKENLVCVRVHEKNRILGLAYNWQGNFSGLYRGVDLTCTGSSYIEYMRLYPDVDKKRLDVKIQIEGDRPSKLDINIFSPDADETIKKQVCLNENTTEFYIDIPKPIPWTLDDPKLYTVEAVLRNDEEILDAVCDRTGFLKLTANGKYFMINDVPCFLKGSLDFMSNPETGCPDTDRDRWKKRLLVFKSYGYNRIRCQSFVPTPEFFDAADETGVLVQSEMGMLGAWGGASTEHVYIWPQPTPDNREALKEQWDLTVKRDINHPSAAFYNMSNEWFVLGNDSRYKRIAWKCYDDTKALKPSAFVVWTDGGLNNEMPGDFITAMFTKDDIKKGKKPDKPLIYHEFGFWSSLPDVCVIKKHENTAIRPFGEEFVLAAAKKHGTDHILEKAAYCSQRLLDTEMKTRTEMFYLEHKDSGLAGVDIGAVDRHGCSQGIIDAFYELKYTTAKKWLKTNGDTVIRSSLGYKGRTLSSGDHLLCEFYVSDFSNPVLDNPVFEWKLVVLDQVLAKGDISYYHKSYENCYIGSIDITIPHIKAAKKAVLSAKLISGTGNVENEWNIWLFPKTNILPDNIYGYGDRSKKYTWLKDLKLSNITDIKKIKSTDVIISEILDDALIKHVNNGGRVIIPATEGFIRPIWPKLGAVPGYQYFLSNPVNYPTLEDGYAGTIINDHPMLGDFIHEGFCDLQFFRMMADSPAIDLEPFGLTAIDPVIRVIHTMGRPLAHLIECEWGSGSIIICSLNLDQSFPEAAYLLDKICKYAAGNDHTHAMRIEKQTLELIKKAACFDL